MTLRIGVLLPASASYFRTPLDLLPVPANQEGSIKPLTCFLRKALKSHTHPNPFFQGRRGPRVQSSFARMLALPFKNPQRRFVMKYLDRDKSTSLKSWFIIIAN